MIRKLFVYCVVLLLLALTVPVSAAKPVGNGTTIRVSVRDRTLTDSSTKEVTTLRDAKQGRNEFELRYDDRIVIAIEDYNPLLFEYTLKLDTPKDTADFTAAVEFAKQLAILMKGLSLAGVSEGQTLGGFSPTEFLAIVDQIQKIVGKVPAYLQRSTGPPAEVAELKKAVDSDHIEANAKAIDQGYVHVMRLLLICVSSKPLVPTDQGGLIDCNAPIEWALSQDRIDKEKKIAETQAAIDALKAADRDLRVALENLRSRAELSAIQKEEIARSVAKLAENVTKIERTERSARDRGGPT